MYTTETERWRALTIRDRNADGHFVYAVKSTGCYCRPTCPARLARRANVEFYKKVAEAEAAGFRACKRCKPDEEINTLPSDLAVAKACALIEEAVKGDSSKSLRLQDLAKSVGLTPRYLHKIFKGKTGMTPKEWVIKATKERNAGAVGPSDRENKAFEGTVFDRFDFDHLLDFNPNAALLSGDVLTPPTPDLPTPGFSSLMMLQGNADVQPAGWDAVMYPNPVMSGTATGNRGTTIGTEATTAFSSGQLSLSCSTTGSTATPAWDAALFMPGQPIPGTAFDLVADGMHLPCFDHGYQDFVWDGV